MQQQTSLDAELRHLMAQHTREKENLIREAEARYLLTGQWAQRGESTVLHEGGQRDKS